MILLMSSAGQRLRLEQEWKNTGVNWMPLSLPLMRRIRKIMNEKRKNPRREETIDKFRRPVVFCYKEKKTGPNPDLFQPENQKVSKFESNVEDNSASLSDFIPALQMLTGCLTAGIAGYISSVYRKRG